MGGWADEKKTSKGESSINIQGISIPPHGTVTTRRAETMKKKYINHLIKSDLPVHLSLPRFSSEPRKQSDMPSHNFEMS